MKRILFVDDDSNVLEGLERALFSWTDTWDLRFATGAQEALEVLAESPVDVLVTDMRMPGMDGAALLREACTRHPDTVRLVLSGHAEVAAAARALAVTHDYLAKPCSPDDLRQALERAVNVQDILAKVEARKVVGRVSGLPPRPKVYSELCSALASEDTSLRDIAAIVQKDVALTAKILHVANTAFFAGARKITNLEAAVSRLGASMIRDLTLSLEALEAFKAVQTPHVSVDAIHEHSVTLATFARRICPDPQLADDVSVAALMHEVGLLLLAREVPDRLDAVAKLMDQGTPRHEAEQAILGVSHAECGAYLLGLWGMPYTVLEAVGRHHQPPAPGQGMTVHSFVYLAEALLLETDHQGRCEGAPLDDALIQELGVADRLPAWRRTRDQLLEAA